MNTKWIHYAVAIIGVFAAFGCGPTKTGLKAREDARERMSIVSAQIHFDQAKQAFETGQFDKALREIKRAIGIYPESAEYDLVLGRILLETHQLEPAIEAFSSAIEKDAKLAEAHYFSGIVHQRWSDDEHAYASYMKAFEIESTNVQYLLASAESLVALGRYDEASDLISPKMAYFEHNAALHQLQGQIALLNGDASSAVDLYSKARLLNPDDNLLLEELMWSQYEAGLFGQCLNSLDQLLDRVTTQRPELMHLEARCLAMMDRKKDARDRYLELSRIRPEDPAIWSELGTLAWDMGDYRRVAMCSVEIIALAPERFEGYMLKGINELHHGNLESAIKLLHQACERSSSDILPYMMLGHVLEQQGNTEQAALAYNRAIDIDPTSAQAQQRLRRLKMSQLSGVSE